MAHGTPLGLPSLAGIASYHEAARRGLTVEQNVLLHTQIGRRWLLPALGDRDAVPRRAEDARAKLQAATIDEPQLRQESKAIWLSAFYASLRERAEED